MDIKDFLTLLGIISTTILSVIALYKAFKTAPKEIKTVDAELSERYQNLAERSLTRANEYEAKLREMEIIVEEHEAEIERLKEKIAKQEKVLKELRTKIAQQELDIAELTIKLNGK
jgi:chromosome segregation ATPase